MWSLKDRQASYVLHSQDQRHILKTASPEQDYWDIILPKIKFKSCQSYDLKASIIFVNHYYTYFGCK